MAQSYDRYKKFVGDGQWKIVPFIKIRENNTDKYTVYEQGKSRMDLISYQYYDNPNYGWLIMQANPHLGSLEYNIPQNSTIRVPYPLNTALQDYENAIEEYKLLYGLD